MRKDRANNTELKKLDQLEEYGRLKHQSNGLLKDHEKSGTKSQQRFYKREKKTINGANKFKTEEKTVYVYNHNRNKKSHLHQKV